MITAFDTMADCVSYVSDLLRDFSHDYDYEAISREAYQWVYGKLLLVHDGPAFWEIVGRHEVDAAASQVDEEPDVYEVDVCLTLRRRIAVKASSQWEAEQIGERLIGNEFFWADTIEIMDDPEQTIWTSENAWAEAETFPVLGDPTFSDATLDALLAASNY